MSDERQETIADVVAAMRDESHAGDGCFLEWVGDKMRSYADRIEAAHKRELESGEKAAQICGEIGEIVGREAARQESLQDCNAAAMRETLLRCDAIAQMPEIREYTIIKEMRDLIKGTIRRSGEELR